MEPQRPSGTPGLRREPRDEQGNPTTYQLYRQGAVVALFGALLLGCGSRPPAPGGAPAPAGGVGAFFGGVALGLFGHPDDPEEADADMAAIAALGAGGVVLPVLWTSPDATSVTIAPLPYGVAQDAYDRSTIEIARRAHARHLAFELRPIVRLERIEPGQWRGTLAPGDWSAWWSSYRAFILHHARVAESAGAEAFCVGSELGSTESQIGPWRSLIADVRRVYHGRILYSANWDHYREVGFWDRLDGVGLSAYLELDPDPDASQERLDSAWRAHRDRILAWARPLGKPLYLTELGYPAQRGAGVHPWDYTRKDPPDPQAQARCFRAFCAAWRDVAELRGVTVWIWEHGKSGPGDSSYAIAGKPAAEVLSGFFRARAGPPPAGER